LHSIPRKNLNEFNEKCQEEMQMEHAHGVRHNLILGISTVRLRNPFNSLTEERISRPRPEGSPGLSFLFSEIWRAGEEEPFGFEIPSRSKGNTSISVLSRLHKLGIYSPEYTRKKGRLASLALPLHYNSDTEPFLLRP
jgi:hypothetical protein